jgi:hypothetical protein
VKIKHSKYKNTGLIFELLIKQIAADTLSGKESPAIKIIKKFFTGNSSLGKEYKLYEYVLKNKGVGSKKSEAVLNTVLELSKKLDNETLRKQKYEIVKDLKEVYDLEEFFSIKVESYKPLAALYCLLEATNQNNIDPSSIVDNKVTILEHLTQNTQSKKHSKDRLIEEYTKYEKDVRLLAYKILLEKFNKQYENLLPEQKHILKEVITSTNSTTKLRNLVNEEIKKIQQEVSQLKTRVEDQIISIKLEEILKNMKPLTNTQKVEDNHLISLMQYYDLVNELKRL